jgi:hypothetical protein
MALIDSLNKTQLDRNDGATLAKYEAGNALEKSLMDSQLDLDGVVPKGPLSDPSYGTINNSFSKGKYLDNLPG